MKTCQLHITDNFQDGAPWNMSFRLNTLHSEIQMDPALCTVKFKCLQGGAKFVVKFPREGQTEAFKCHTFALTPPLHLSIDTCISFALNFHSFKFSSS